MRTIQILVAVGCMFATSMAMTQVKEYDNREEVTFAIKAGLNYSNVYDSSSEEFRADPKFGFAGGAVFAFPINKYLGIQPELLISQKGFKGSGAFLGSQYTFTRTTTYIDLPIQMSFKPSEFFTIIAGPQYSYLIKQKDVFTSPFINTEHEQEFKNDNIRRNLLGAVVGVDINVKHIVIGTRAGWDFMDNHGDGSSSTPRYKNFWLQATIGYIFYNK